MKMPTLTTFKPANMQAQARQTMTRVKASLIPNGQDGFMKRVVKKPVNLVSTAITKFTEMLKGILNRPKTA